MQRPSAKDLLKHRFIQRSKKTGFLAELVERYKHWRVTHPESDDDEAEDSDQYDTDTDTHADIHGQTHRLCRHGQRLSKTNGAKPPNSVAVFIIIIIMFLQIWKKILKISLI